MYLIKSLSYATYALTPNVTDLHFIGCYAWCQCYFTEHQLPCLELARIMLHVIFLCMLSAAIMSYVMCCSHAQK